jgi:predicted transglutaminase-like cysteine proteinase
MPKKHGLNQGWIRAAGVALMMMAAGGVQAQSGQRNTSTGSPGASGPLTTGALPPVMSLDVVRNGDSRPPIGWVQFCAARNYAAECAVDTSEPEKVELTPKLWRTVTSINSRVNKEIEPVTDIDHWGIVERWDMAEDGRGDCEEYVLIKRKRLVEAGIPRRALRVVVVIDDENAGHAVLMLRTDRGDFILDNKRNAVLAWHQTGYVYVKRESQDRIGWVALGGVSGPQMASR